jgi:hypothetical protein
VNCPQSEFFLFYQVEGKDTLDKSGKKFTGVSKDKRKSLGLGLPELKVQEAVARSCAGLLEDAQEELVCFLRLGLNWLCLFYNLSCSTNCSYVFKLCVLDFSCC